MKPFIILYFLILVAGFSCSDSSRPADPAPDQNKRKTTSSNKPPGGYSDTLEIDYPAAVFYNPDSLQLQKIKTMTDTMVAESMIHECFYQMRYARTVLTKSYPAIKIVEANKVRFLLFKQAAGENKYIDLDTFNEPCGLFIFNRFKKAERVDMTNVETQLGFYFSPQIHF